MRCFGAETTLKLLEFIDEARNHVEALVPEGRVGGVEAERRQQFLVPLHAARAQHVQEVIRPALHSGHILLCDRYTDATWAYQHGGRGLPVEQIKTLCDMAEQGVQPDFTFVFDMPCELALRRLAIRQAKPGQEVPSRFDEEALAFHDRVRAQYLLRAKQFAERMIVIDASGEIKEVTKMVMHHLRDHLDSEVA